jgi:mono/diheme cytochrome c family protein
MRLVAGLLLGLCAAAHAAGPGEPKARGEALLEKNCAHCHAIGATGDSPLKSAPPMRDVSARLAPKELQTGLKEGHVSPHHPVPLRKFSEADSDAILAYLNALTAAK